VEDTERDDIEAFAPLMVVKFNEGRRKYKDKGLATYSANSLEELQSELVDYANYAAKAYFEIERAKARFGLEQKEKKPILPRGTIWLSVWCEGCEREAKLFIADGQICCPYCGALMIVYE